MGSLAYTIWLLTREVLQVKSKIARDQEWDVMVDLFMYRDPDATKEADKVEAPRMTLLLRKMLPSRLSPPVLSRSLTRMAMVTMLTMSRASRLVLVKQPLTPRTSPEQQWTE